MGGVFVPLDVYPPGCSETGGVYTTTWIVDDRTFVISNAKQRCGAPPSAAMRGLDCTADEIYTTYRVPTLRRGGTYRIGQDATAIVERRFPVTRGDGGSCVCLPSIDRPEALDAGTLKIDVHIEGASIGVGFIENGKEVRGYLIGDCPWPWDSGFYEADGG